jgi:serine/threonine protein kinase
MNHEDIYPHDAENPEFSDELIGQTFGVYRIKREIGRGGMGVVYLAERIDGAFKQEVAVKFVKPIRFSGAFATSGKFWPH